MSGRDGVIQVTMPQVGFRKHVISGRDSVIQVTMPQVEFRKLRQKWERQCDSANHATSGIQETMSEVGETV